MQESDGIVIVAHNNMHASAHVQPTRLYPFSTMNPPQPYPRYGSFNSVNVEEEGAWIQDMQCIHASKHEPAIYAVQPLCLSCHTTAAGFTGELNDAFDGRILTDFYVIGVYRCGYLSTIVYPSSAKTERKKRHKGHIILTWKRAK
jgi:hypothetical protein